MRCPDCGDERQTSPRVILCACERTESQADAEAARFAFARGVEIEREDRKLGLCGDRFPAPAQLGALSSRVDQRARRAGLCERLRERLAVMDRLVQACAEERPSLAVQVEILERHLRGESQERLVRVAGVRHRATVSRLLSALDAAPTMTHGDAPVALTLPCACGCGLPVVWGGVGRRRVYARARCSATVRNRLYRLRLRRRKAGRKVAPDSGR